MFSAEEILEEFEEVAHKGTEFFGEGYHYDPRLCLTKAHTINKVLWWREWRAKNPVKAKAQYNTFEANNRERRREYKRALYASNREAILSKRRTRHLKNAKASYERNREAILERRRARYLAAKASYIGHKTA